MDSQEITIEMMRENLYAAVVSDALDALGYKNQSPRVPLLPQTVEGVLVGRCKTTQWEDIDFEDPSPYELELQAIDACQPDDVLICAADGSMHSGVWGNCYQPPRRIAGVWEQSFMGLCVIFPKSNH